MKQFRKKTITMVLLAVLLIGIVSYAIPAGNVQAANATIKLTVKHPSMNTIRLSWNKVDDAYGYKVYYKDKASATYELVSETLEDRMVFEGLKSDHFYYFRVEAYDVVNGAQVVVASSEEVKAQSNKIGIDVSKWNGTIDWPKVKKAGIEYAIVRVSYGTSTTAEKLYKQNIEGAKAAGIPVGVYIYSIASTVKEAQKEADYVLSLIDGYDLEYPVAFDIEDKKQSDNGSTSAGRALNTKLTKAFCDKIEAAGYDAMIYTGCSFSRTYLNMSDLSDYDLWIAHYGSTKNYTSYTGSYHYGSSCNASSTRFWQYSSLGKVNGITGNVDMNYELDLGTGVRGMVRYHVSKKTEVYVAGSGETLESIANKYNVSVEQLIEADSAYTKSSTIKKGSKIKINSSELVSNGRSVAEVTNVTAVSAGYNSVQLTWSPVNYSDGYYVYRSDKEDGTYTKIKTVTAASYKDKNLKYKKTYYYKVYGFRKIEEEIVTSPTAGVASAAPIQATPLSVKVSKATYDSVTLSWKKSSGATKYKVYVATTKNGTYKKAGYTTTTSFTHKKRKLGTTYYYKVAAIRTVDEKNYWSEKSAMVTGKPALEQVKMTSAVSGTRKASLKWSKVKGAKGYVIYRATTKNGTYKKIATMSKTSYTNYPLTSKKKYYYKVRAYRTVNGKNLYGAYSPSYRITVK